MSCDSEYGTNWGKKLGWLYGSKTEDVLAGLMIHKKRLQIFLFLAKRDGLEASLNLGSPGQFSAALYSWVVLCCSSSLFHRTNSSLLPKVRTNLSETMHATFFWLLKMFQLRRFRNRVYAFLLRFSWFTTSILYQSIFKQAFKCTHVGWIKTWQE